MQPTNTTPWQAVLIDLGNSVCNCIGTIKDHGLIPIDNTSLRRRSAIEEDLQPGLPVREAAVVIIQIHSQLAPA